uniref:Ig-like domain-containing protein n=1 Tax=Gasterosteus aculeatus aculeatus TaxID=481459 RepID=A0AAQ4RUZ2_GASAC|nr:cell surface A33 antigen-like [Gasterosteus aculeatus aculeatus]
MIAKRQFEWRKLFLIVTVLPCCRSLQVSIPKKEYEVARGGDITLTCSFIPARPVTKSFVLTWEGFPKKEGDPMLTVATYFINNPVDIAPNYEGRATVEVNINTQQSTLHLTNVNALDSRIYQCSVMILNDGEGTTSATTSLMVLVPPSKPICKIEGEAVFFQDITLTCRSEEGSPTPLYKWNSYSVQSIPRAFPPKATEKDGALSLFNISTDTSGFYTCTSTNRIGSSSCNLTLAVTPGSMNVGSTAAIVGGVLAGVVILGIVIYCCCCKKKGKEEQYAEGDPGETAYYDRDGSEAGEPYRDDKSNSMTKQANQHEDKDIVPQNNYVVNRVVHKSEDDEHSDVDSRRNQDDQRDHHRGSRDNLDDERYGGSRDRLDDKRNHGSGSRDRLDEQRNRYGGSRDRLEDQHESYRGSRDRLDDQHESYRGSRDRLDDQRDAYRGSRDRLDDQRDAYRGSRDRLDDQRNRYGGSRDRLDDQHESYRGSRDRLDNQRDAY